MAWNRHGRGTAVGSAFAAAALALAGNARVAPGDEPRPGDPRVELGRRLFFDPAVSRSGDNSCVSCHRPEHAFSSAARFDADDFSRTRRHSQTLVDAALSPSFHWDGEFESIAELVVARLTPDATAGTGVAVSASGGGGGGGGGGYGGGGSVSSTGKTGVPREASPRTPSDPAPEAPPLDDDAVGGAGTPPSTDGYAPTARAAGAPERREAAREDRRHVLGKLRTANDPEAKLDHPTVAERIEGDRRYEEGFVRAFGSKQVTFARIGEAITAYVDTLRSGTSPYDRFAAGDERALSDAAKRGLELFRGRAGCVQCHVATGPHPAFTDRLFHDTGISARARVRFVTTGPGADPAGDGAARVLLPRDLGRGRLTSSPMEDAAFKTPTLRDVAKRPPYMHDGSLDTLARVVRRYAAGGTPDADLDLRIRRFECSDRDVLDLVAFLESLTSDVPVGTAPPPRDRAERTEVRFVDAKGRGIAGIAVDLVADGDRLPGDPPGEAAARTVRTDPDGWIEFAPARRTHTRLSLEDGLRIPQGGMVPDSCRRLTLALPVAGRTSLTVVLPAAAPLPPRLPVDRDLCELTDEAIALLTEHAPAVLAHARERVATFVLVKALALADLRVATYEAWVPAPAASPGDGARRTTVAIASPTGPRRVAVALEAGKDTRVDLTK